MANIKTIAKNLGILKLEDSEKFDSENITLSQEETEKAISEALRRKKAEAYKEHYNRMVLKENTMPKLTAEQLYKIVIAKGTIEIPGFKLDERTEITYQILSEYFTEDPQFEARGFSQRKGLLIFGGVGTGKTTIMKLFSQNPLASFVIRSCRTIAGDYAKNGEVELEKYSGLFFPTMVENYFKTDKWGICFDDLGTEDVKSHYKNETNVMQRIILDRYDRKNEIPYRTHITTNLDAEQIIDFYGERAASRIREMFNVFEIKGKDLRK